MKTTRYVFQSSLALMLAITTASAQRTIHTGGTREGTVETPPARVHVRAEKQRRTITLVGRNERGVVFTENEQGLGTRLLLAYDKIEEAIFDFRIDDLKLMQALRSDDWMAAVRAMYPALQPVLPYLDLPNNNALALSLDMGNYAMLGGRQAMLDATTDAEREAAGKRYGMAFTILRHVANAGGTIEGKLAALKQIQCLLAMDRNSSAATLFKRAEEPRVGERDYGLYWLIAAELALLRKDYRAAMDCAVKSLCFENKDIDTFPDALLISGMCYEELQNWHRARDIYYEVARIFPRTAWYQMAMRRLRFIREQGLTNEPETSPIESVFFGWQEDMNELVDALLANPPAEETYTVPVYAGAAKVEETDEPPPEIDWDTAE